MSDIPKRPDLVPPSWGRPLTEQDYIALESCWITSEVADAAMLRRVDSFEGREVVGQKGNRDCAGILISYYWPGENSAFNHRLRRDNPDWVEGRGSKPKQDRKYLGPPNSGNRLYVPPGVTLEQLADPEIPIALVEGEKKALALWRLAHHDTDKPRFIPIAIAGVWNWRGRTGKTGGPNGERLDVKGPIPDLRRIAWKIRKVFIVFDANVQSNDSVKWARKGIARELGTRGAAVDLVNLPEDCGVNGVDDLLALWGPERVLELFKNSVSGARLEIVQSPQFYSRPDGLIRVVTRGEKLVEIRLTNFQATITANICLDDGVETKREFEIQAELLGRRSQFSVSSSEFARMDWAIERLGSSAITFPNQREYARTAIQSLSMTAEEHSVYTHTGWRRVDGVWLYLHSGGAIGSAGSVPNINVRLSGATNGYRLDLASDASTLACAIAASLRLADLGPPSICIPLLAATYRPILGNADFAMHLAGETGAFKSELAALHQQHFGAGMNRLHLPGAWSSTGNAIETMAFHAKDALFVIDDFAPQGNSSEVARLHAAADRVLRAVGNHAGRSRLDSTAKLREPKPPRAVILSTGEDIPRGQSIRARMLILEIAKGGIKTDELTACQNDAQQGLYAIAMGGFIQWAAGSYEENHAAFDAKVLEYRAMALRNAAHARTPDIVANLQAAFELFLDFAVASGGLDEKQRNCLAARSWEALREAASSQAKHQTATEPTARFLALLRSLISSGRAHLEARMGGAPARSPESCGWRCDGPSLCLPLGDRIGWVDEDDVYLEPATANRLIRVAARDSGEELALGEQTLRKRLHEKGLLASVDSNRETLTVRKNIGGSSKSVLHFLRATILPDLSDGDEDAE